MVQDTATNQAYFSSFGTSGYHRTIGEIENKHSVQQAAAGGTLHFQNPFFKIGLNAVQYHFSMPLQKRGEPYNLYAISGTNWLNASTEYALTYRNIHLFGEAAMDKRKTKLL